ncbi:MAG: DMT family transporter [Verrucomicrobiales bacterium]|nr:DMT family transporter [Verrucomicrobiales bacterium]
MVPALLTTILFALSAVCATRTTKILGGIEANFFRISIATLLLAFWAHAFGTGFSGQAFPYFFLSGCVGFGIGDTALYQALPRLGSRLCMVLVHCLAAPFAAAVEWSWLGTRITGFQIFCGAGILTGITIALLPDRATGLARSGLGTGTIFGIVAGCGQGFGAVLSRKAYQIADLSGEEIHGVIAGISAAYQRILAGWIFAAAFYFVAVAVRKRFEPGRPDTSSNATRHNLRSGRFGTALPWLLGNALSGPFIGVSCFQWALATAPTAIVLPVVAMTPLVVIPFARFAEGDRPSPRALIGVALAVLGVVALTWTRLKN